MSKYVFANNATSRLAVDIDESTTGILVFPGEGERFPDPQPDEDTYFTVTLEDRRSGQIEICRCAERHGDNLVVTRGQEGTVAQFFYAGASVSNRVTAKTVGDLYDFSYTKGEADDLFVNVLGDTMTGSLILPGPDPTKLFEAVHKKYVDNLVSLRTPAALVSAATLTYYASEGQTIFTCDVPDIFGNRYTLNSSGGEEPIDVHINGVRSVLDNGQVGGGDYTVHPELNQVTINQPLPAGTVVSIDVWTPRDRLAPGSVNIHMLAPIAVDGVATTFRLTRLDDGSAVIVLNSEEVLFYVNGVPQIPYSDYTVSFDTLAFAVPPEADARCWGFWMEPAGRPTGAAGDIHPPSLPADAYRNVYAWDPQSRQLGWADARPLHQVVGDVAARDGLVVDRDFTIGSLATQTDTGDTSIFTGTRGAPTLVSVAPPDVVTAPLDGRWLLDTSNVSAPQIRPNHNSTWYVDDVFDFTIVLDSVTTHVRVNLVGPVLGNNLMLDAFLRVVDISESKVVFTTDAVTFITTCNVQPTHIFQVQAIRSARGVYPIEVAEIITDASVTNYAVEVLSPVPPIGSKLTLTLDAFDAVYDILPGDTIETIATAFATAFGGSRPLWSIAIDGASLEIVASAAIPYGRTAVAAQFNQPGPVEDPEWHTHVPALIRRDILQVQTFSPTAGEPFWIDARHMYETVNAVSDLTNPSSLPPNRQLAGKLVYVKATRATYQRLNDPPGAGTIADWRIVIPAPP